MNLEFLTRSLYKQSMPLKKINPHHFSSIRKVLEMNTSVAIRRRFLAMTSNYITCMPFSAGAETQHTLCYQSPAEEICHGAFSINLFHILSVDSINSVQFSWSLSNSATSGETQEWTMSGRAMCLTGDLYLTPHFYQALFPSLYFLTLYIDRDVL